MYSFTPGSLELGLLSWFTQGPINWRTRICLGTKAGFLPKKSADIFVTDCRIYMSTCMDTIARSAVAFAVFWWIPILSNSRQLSTRKYTTRLVSDIVCYPLRISTAVWIFSHMGKIYIGSWARGYMAYWYYIVCQINHDWRLGQFGTGRDHKAAHLWKKIGWPFSDWWSSLIAFN